MHQPRGLTLVAHGQTFVMPRPLLGPVAPHLLLKAHPLRDEHEGPVKTGLRLSVRYAAAFLVLTPRSQ
jgi:hypothetical protein